MNKNAGDATPPKIFWTGLFAFELGYIVFFYDPFSSHTDAGIMLILAAETSFAVQIATSNLQEKKIFGKMPRTSRLFAILFWVPLLGLAAVSAGIWQLQHHRAVWIILFVALAIGKLAWWHHQNGQAKAIL